MNRRFLKLCCGRKSAFFKRNQSIIALTAQAGAKAPRPTRLSVKSSPCRRYWSRASVLGTNGLAARVEALAPCALASFVNGKFNSAGVEGRLWAGLPRAINARGNKIAGLRPELEANGLATTAEAHRSMRRRAADTRTNLIARPRGGERGHTLIALVTEY